MEPYLTVTFEDDGQDFLEFDINEEGEITDCRPFQAWLWTKFHVLNVPKVGGHLVVQQGEDDPLRLKYPLVKVVTHRKED